MKYILVLSLSGICLAAFLFVIQGEIPNGSMSKEGFSAFVGKVEAASGGIEKGQAEDLSKSSLSRNEAIRKVLKEKTWPEAKPEVQKILKEYKANPAGRRNETETVPAREYDRSSVDNAGSAVISREDAENIALRDVPGEIVGSKMKKGNYRVKVWSEGVLYKVYIDSQTGEILRKKIDD